MLMFFLVRKKTYLSIFKIWQQDKPLKYHYFLRFMSTLQGLILLLLLSIPFLNKAKMSF